MPTPMLVSTTTPTPSPTLNPSLSPGVPSALGSASPSPLPSLTPYSGEDVAEATSSFAWSEKGAPSFTVDQAVITALQQNPQILSALEQIKVAKGVIIEIRAEVLPHVGPDSTIDWIDHNLHEFSTFGGGGGPGGIGG